MKYSEAQMQIRKPISEVFQAFIDPELTEHFWFTNGSDKLEVGKPVTWTWEMYNFSTKVIATEILTDKKLVFIGLRLTQQQLILNLNL
ncbi:MAG: SRPBCC domain-containing protein [Chitinophagaceae bacterium]